MQNLIAVDPGLRSAGWAVFHGQDIVSAGIVNPRQEYREEEVVTRAVDVGQQLGDLVHKKFSGVTHAIVEMPVYYGPGDKNAGSIFKLCVCIGSIAQALNERGVIVETVNVPEWKGQLPKEVVIRRIKIIVPDWAIKGLNLEKDMWDAVGIGLWKLGRFK